MKTLTIPEPIEPESDELESLDDETQDLEFAQFTDDDKEDRYDFDNMCKCGNPRTFCTCYL
jgi:hypothetical protein